MTTVPAPITLADALPAVRLRSAVLVVGAALLTAAAAQISIPLGFTPVPITGQTFAVLLTAAALGSRLGVASQGLYWLLGAVGLPFYAEGAGGWTAATGATMGYFVGFVLAAAFVGHLAERGQDRNVSTSIPAMLAGTAIIYAAGVSWLAHSLDVPFYAGDGADAFTYGLAPFIPGDIVKLVLAAVITPAAWRALQRAQDRD
jgi:biotin transport system substrate-specific component